MNKNKKVSSNRKLKIGELIKHALSEIFSSGKIMSNIIGNTSITVTEVRMSADLKIAEAFVIPLGSVIDKNVFINDLEDNIFNIRASVTKIIKLKYSPKIKFIFDNSFDNVEKFNSIYKTLESN